ncbi:MAG: c-type cytochrome [Bacillus sp. (in: firmicutes)]
MHRGKGMKFVGDSRIVAPGMRKPNIPKDYSEYPGKTEAFWPNFLLKEWMVGAVFLIGFLCLCIAHQPPLEKMADPAASGYIPLPDWYFLFLYQLLKYTYASGENYNIIGSLIMPGLAFGALLFAPFLDRGPERAPLKRPFATGFMLLAIVSIFYLTYQSVAMHDWEAAKKQGEIVLGPEINQEDPGYAIYEQSCVGCHGGNLEGGAAAPKLFGTGLTAEEIADIAVNGVGSMPAGMFKGTDEELQVLAEFIANLEE